MDIEFKSNAIYCIGHFSFDWNLSRNRVHSIFFFIVVMFDCQKISMWRDFFFSLFDGGECAKVKKKHSKLAVIRLSHASTSCFHYIHPKRIQTIQFGGIFLRGIFFCDFYFCVFALWKKNWKTTKTYKKKRLYNIFLY